MKVTENVGRVLSIELMAAAQALHILSQNNSNETPSNTADPFRIPPLVQRVASAVQEVFPPLDEDRYTVPQADLVYEAVMDGRVFNLVQDDLSRAADNGVVAPTPTQQQHSRL